MKQKIIDILRNHEKCISDGFVYYCETNENPNDIETTLNKIADDIIKVFEAK